VTSASDGVARVWNDKGEIKCMFKATNMLLASKWNKDSTYIASGGQDQQIIIWKPTENSANQHFLSFKQDSDVIDIDWSSTHEFASAHSDNSICLWNIGNSQPDRVWRGHQSSIAMIKWDPAGGILASCADEDDMALIWSPR
jgi:WD40 repeat protein